MPTFAVKTFGCKLNQYETERMAQALVAAGYVRVGWRENADMYLINSCTVTAKADRKTRAAHPARLPAHARVRRAAAQAGSRRRIAQGGLRPDPGQRADNALDGSRHALERKRPT